MAVKKLNGKLYLDDLEKYRPLEENLAGMVCLYNFDVLYFKGTS